MNIDAINNALLDLQHFSSSLMLILLIYIILNLIFWLMGFSSLRQMHKIAREIIKEAQDRIDNDKSYINEVASHFNLNKFDITRISVQSPRSFYLSQRFYGSWFIVNLLVSIALFIGLLAISFSLGRISPYFSLSEALGYGTGSVSLLPSLTGTLIVFLPLIPLFYISLMFIDKFAYQRACARYASAQAHQAAVEAEAKREILQELSKHAILQELSKNEIPQELSKNEILHQLSIASTTSDTSDTSDTSNTSTTSNTSDLPTLSAYHEQVLRRDFMVNLQRKRCFQFLVSYTISYIENAGQSQEKSYLHNAIDFLLSAFPFSPLHPSRIYKMMVKDTTTLPESLNYLITDNSLELLTWKRDNNQITLKTDIEMLPAFIQEMKEKAYTVK